MGHASFSRLAVLLASLSHTHALLTASSQVHMCGPDLRMTASGLSALDASWALP